MVKVFILGASGYIGYATAAALRKRGHHVTGLARSAEKGKALVEAEVDLVIGDTLKLETYPAALREADVIISTSYDMSNPNFDEIALNNILEALKGTKGNRKRLVNLSGCMVYNEDRSGLVTEESPYNPNFILPGRIATDERVLALKDIDGVVVRPAVVYGGTTGAYYKYFQAAEEGKLAVFGDGKNSISNLHIDDVASALVLVVEAEASKVASQVFNLGSDVSPTLLEIAQAFGAAASFTGKIETGATAPFAMMTSQIVLDCSKAKKVLGWKLSRPNVIQEAPRLYRAWKSAKFPGTFL